MPIKGLTDRGLAFAQIGVIRKGAPKDAGGNKPGADLKYFRVEFDEAEQESAAIFRQVYGDKPTRIRVVFPFDDLDQLAQFWLEAYTAGRMVARSDGEIYHYKVDMKTGEVLVKDGKNVKTGEPWPYDPTKPEGFYINSRTQKEEPVYCKQTGRIRVVVPELKRYAYLLLLTTSINDIKNLSEQLQGIWEGNHHHIAGIHFILQRKPRKVSCPDPRDKSRRVRYEKWMLSIEPDPEWVEKKLLAMRADSLRFDAPKPQAALPARAQSLVGAPTPGPATGDTSWMDVPPAEDFGAEDEDIEGEFSEEEPEGEGETESMVEAGAGLGAAVTDTSEKPNAPALPPLRLQPDALKTALLSKAKTMTGECTPEKKGVIATVLEAALGTPDPKAARKMLLKYLTGHDSLTELNNSQLLALYSWLKPEKDPMSGEWFADAMAAREAQAAFTAAQPPQETLF